MSVSCELNEEECLYADVGDGEVRVPHMFSVSKDVLRLASSLATLSIAVLLAALLSCTGTAFYFTMGSSVSPNVAHASSSLSLIPSPRSARAGDCVYYSGLPDECPMDPVSLDAVAQMNVVITSCGTDVRQDALISIKSWMLQRVDGLHLHFFVILSDSPIPFAEQRQWFDDMIFGRWPRSETNPAHFNISYLNINDIPPHLHELLKAFRLCSTARLFLTYLLPPTVDAVVYIDADSVAIADVRRLWAEFQYHSPTQMLGAAWEANGVLTTPQYYATHVKEAFPWPEPWGLNAGILLINVTKVRNFRWMNGSLEKGWDEKVVSIFTQYGKLLQLADQDVINVLVAEEEEYKLWLPMPSSYNWRTGTVGMRSGAPKGMTIVHGNDHSFHKDNIRGHANPYIGIYLWFERYWQWPSSLEASNFYGR